MMREDFTSQYPARPRRWKCFLHYPASLARRRYSSSEGDDEISLFNTLCWDCIMRYFSHPTVVCHLFCCRLRVSEGWVKWSVFFILKRWNLLRKMLLHLFTFRTGEWFEFTALCYSYQASFLGLHSLGPALFLFLHFPIRISARGRGVTGIYFRQRNWLALGDSVRLKPSWKEPPDPQKHFTLNKC